MEIPPANSELKLLQPMTSQLTPTAIAAWHVLGLLLSHGRPARPAELSSRFTFFYPTPDFIRFLCSIRNSPLQLTDNHSVTFSQIGVVAIAKFFAHSNLITRSLDPPIFVGRFSANVRSSDVVRTYSRKRKSPESEILEFPLMKKSYIQNFNAENNLNEMVLPRPDEFQNIHTQVVGMLSNHSSISAYKCCKWEKSMFRPAMFTKSISGKLCYEFENAEQGYNETEVKFPKRDSLGFLNPKKYKSDSLFRGRFPNIDKIAEEAIMNSDPHPELSLVMGKMDNFEGKEIGDVGTVTPGSCINNCTSFKLETDEDMIVSQEENEDVIQVCESLAEDMNGKRKEVSLHVSETCGGHKDNQSMDATYTNRSHIDNPEKTLGEANNEALFLIRPRTKGHLLNQGNMLSHLMEYSSMPQPDLRGEAYDGERAICPTTENCKGLPDKGSEQFKRDKNTTPDKKKTKYNCNQNANTKERRETSIGNRKRASSIPNNQTDHRPFPDFESFVVEEEEGSGGYGTVYRARRKADAVTFALKCPHVAANRNYVHNEMKMLERLGGKNFVIRYEGSFKSGSADCLVLEHVEHDRPEILKREINIFQLQWYGYCLFKALSGLHKQGIIHRDVKPGNFLYSRKVNKGYLIDFNLALDMRKKYKNVDNSKSGHDLNEPIPSPQTKSLPPSKNRKLITTRLPEAVNKNVGKVPKSILPPGNLKKKVDKVKVLTETRSWNIIKSQGADGSGITSAKDPTSTRTISAERLREPLPSQGRKELLSLVQEALQGGNHESVNAPTSKRKRVAAPPGNADRKLLYPTPMPLYANGIAVGGAGLQTGKGDSKRKREGPCVGTKGFKAPEVGNLNPSFPIVWGQSEPCTCLLQVLFRSLHQGPKADIWSAGVTLLYLMIGRTPFVGDTDQNIKEIAKLRGSEDLWEVAKIHNHESLFPADLLDVKYLSPAKLQDWCARNTRRPDFLESIPGSLFDLVDKCLMVNPRQRISAEEGLRHDFFSPCHETLRKRKLQREGLSLDSGTAFILHGDSQPSEIVS